jgi:hypothetical protein
MMKTKKSILFSGLIIISWAIIALVGKRPPSAQVLPARSISEASSKPGTLPQIISASGARSEVLPAVADLQSKLGPVTVEYLPDGRIASIRGKLGLSPAGYPFHPEDASQAIARALEIIEWTRDSLGIRKSLPLGKPHYRGNTYSAQVSFRETAEGQPVYPFGSVSVDLGRDGELLGLYSNYLSQVQVSNASDPTLPVDQAKQQVIDSTGLSSIRGGTPIVWSGPTEVPGDARRAYQFYARGWEVVADATTGAILSRQDRRTF